MAIPFHIQQKFMAFNKSVQNFCDSTEFRYNGKGDYFRMAFKFKKDNSAYDNFKVIADLQLLCHSCNFISFVKITKEPYHVNPFAQMSKNVYRLKIVNNPLNK